MTDQQQQLTEDEDVSMMSMVGVILKRRDVTLPTKVRLAKAMVFPVVMYGCESCPDCEES